MGGFGLYFIQFKDFWYVRGDGKLLFKSRRFWLGLIVSAIFLTLFFWRVDPSETWVALGDANYWWLIPAVLAYFVAVAFRSVRWHFLLMPMKSVPSNRLFPIVVIGYMANNLLPIRLGELVRAFFVGQKEGISKSGALATILVERLFDGVFLILVALIVWPFLPVADLLSDFGESTSIPQMALVLIITIPFLLVLGIFFAAALFRPFGDKVVNGLLVVIPGRLKSPAKELMGGFIDGLAALRHPKRVTVAMLLTAPVWLAEAAMFLLIAQGFRIHEGFHGMLLVTSTSNLATSLPSSAGGIGPFEYATRITLESFGVVAELAAAYAIVLHVALLVPVTILGFYFLWSGNISLVQATRNQMPPNVSERVRRKGLKS